MLDELRDLIAKIIKENILIIVEGKKDKSALEYFGLKNIITLGKPLYKIIESITAKECIILTDFDAEGKELYGKLSSQLMMRGIRINDELRNFLMKMKIKQIEGLPSLFHKTYKSPRHQVDWND